MRSKNQLKLFTYVIVLFMGTTAVSLFIYNNIKTFEQVIINQSQQHLLNIAKTESTHFERFIHDIRDDLKMLALTPRIQNDLAHVHDHPLKNISATEKYEAVKFICDHFADRINAIYAIDTNGIVKCRVPRKIEQKGADYSEKPGVKAVIKNQKPYISELFQTNSGHHAISVCLPVFKDEKFIGILRALIHTETMCYCPNDSKIGQKGYAWMIDDNGIMISHPKTEHIGKHNMTTRKRAFPDYDWFELENIVAKMTSGQSGVGIYHSAWWLDEKPELIRKLIAFAPVRIGNELWSIGVSMSYDEISGPIKAHSRNLLLGAGFIILLFIYVGIGFYRAQKRQVELQVKVKSAEKLNSINQKLLSEITDRKKAEETLRANEAQLSNAMKIANLGYWEYDVADDQFTFNDHLYHIFHTTAKQVGGYKMKSARYAELFLHPDDRQVVAIETKKALETTDPQYSRQLEHRILYATGEIGYISVRFVIVKDKQGRTIKTFGANQDITDHKQAELKQVELFEKVENVNKELKDFASIISHDLKAPLRGIKTLANWILSDCADELGEEANEQMNLLLERVELMYNLIEGVLQYSRAGRAEGKRVPVNLNDFVPEIINMVVPPENITVTIEDELPVFKCEEIHIMQIFQNLLSNAIKYMDKPQGRIQVGCVEQDGFWKFSVADNGPGIEEKHFERIFKIFQALPTSPDFQGTGVGLTVTKKLVELYNGRIWIESKVGEGSTFFFTLPKQEIGALSQKLEANIAC